MGRSAKSHRKLKDRAMNRVDDLQGMLMDLQSARKESRKIDMALLEEQVHQMLKEWKKELNEPSPASSSLQQGASLLSFSPDISRLLQLYDEEEDDATSGLAAPKPDPDAHNTTQDIAFHKVAQEQSFKPLDQCKDFVPPYGMNMTAVHNTCVGAQLDQFSFDFPHEFEENCVGRFYGMWSEDGSHPITGFLPNICPPPSAFLGPKCALWDCPRPAQAWGFERAVQWWCTVYCSHLHAAIAQTEGQPGMNPIIRPKGIELKDNLLFSALCAKAQGKNVGVPSAKGPPLQNRHGMLPGETLREWLFFDKPRRAFESGNRKQRSLPDYNGRGWHESRKQVINESGWLKRSYYMDPQPMKFLEWHLYEYEITKYDACALYRLELKLVDRKRSPKGKIGDHSVVDLQKQMGRLSAEFRLENNKRSVKGRGRASATVYPASTQTAPMVDVVDYGANTGFNYLMEDLGGYYFT
ncbi:hypothetical protein OSB04_001924 [Centaurea solstitialis]|uniref:Transcription factor VOZ1 n=1 Tax=Centaurea solstitialis TaxID=347529 RepID=A0AA38UAM2_9ASTR|nr:hypothetical protein OSB04_001924 [Centaurea solstitialis]